MTYKLQLTLKLTIFTTRKHEERNINTDRKQYSTVFFPEVA